MHRLRHILRSNMVRSDVTPEQVVRINAALMTAVEAIEKELTPQSADTTTDEQEKN
ncbi:PadR family transcriptional regulator [Yersinia enterocolitica]|nr:PadR family transcriptional regulator [Yersinia enterocolitica]